MSVYGDDCSVSLGLDFGEWCVVPIAWPWCTHMEACRGRVLAPVSCTGASGVYR